MDPTRKPVEPANVEYQIALQRARLAALCPEDRPYREEVEKTLTRTLLLLHRHGEVRPGGRKDEGEVRELLAYSDKVEPGPNANGSKLCGPAFRRYAKENGVGDWGDSRWFDLAVHLLREGRPDRRLVWPLTAPVPREPLPCVTQVQFLPRGDRLHAVLTIRSSNAVNELLVDLLYWAEFTRALGADHQLRLGTVYFNAGSLHLHTAGEAAFPLMDYLSE